jgi:integrase
MKLTKRSVEAIQPPEKGIKAVWDSVLPGFGVRVLPSGRKVYVIRYRTTRGVGRLLTIGRCEEMHPEEARDRAREAFADVRKGLDPKGERDTLRKSPRLQDLRDAFMERHAAFRKPGTQRNYEIAWRRHILPALGNPVLVEITKSDIDRFHSGMRATPINANRSLEVLSKALALAEEWGWLAGGGNPSLGVKAFSEAKRERILGGAELTLLWGGLDTLPFSCPFPSLVKLLLLTGCRLSEWREAEWAWVDLEARVLRLPDSKTGAKVVHLADEVLDILAALPRSSRYVLPGAKGKPMQGHQKMWQRLLRSVGLSGVRLHDLRHTLASHAHRQGLSQKAIADLLGHKQMSTAARYIQNLDHLENVKTASATIIRFAKTA